VAPRQAVAQQEEYNNALKRAQEGVIAAAARAPAASPDLKSAKAELARLVQDAESEALTSGRSSWQYSDEYKNKIADYKLKHGI